MPITTLKGNCCSVCANDDVDDHDDGYDENDRRQEDDACINIIKNNINSNNNNTNFINLNPILNIS